MSNRWYKSVNDRSDDLMTASEDELLHDFKYIYPGGSGPLGVMSMAAAGIIAVAKLRGFDTSGWHEP